jgi:hypothetical protein
VPGAGQAELLLLIIIIAMTGVMSDGVMTVTIVIRVSSS